MKDRSWGASLSKVLHQPWSGVWLRRAERWAFSFWTLVSLLASLAKIRLDRHNNFTIFRSSWLHFSDALPLYLEYPNQYTDIYLYGPLFAVLIAPIALLPEPIGYLVWQIALSSLLFFALSKLPISSQGKVFIGLFTINELVTALMMQQWNIGIVALVILTYCLVEREQEHWAALCIVIGLLTKIYGIVGLAFFPFSKHKLRFILWGLIWIALLGTLPILVGGLDYTLGQYQLWVTTLGAKGNTNLFSLIQNISLLGMIRKISGCTTYSDLIPIALGLIVYGLPYLRFGQYRSKLFRLMLLSSTLLFLVLFSTGSESSSYVIAFPAIALWYWLHPNRNSWDLALLVGCFLLSSLSPTDIFPRALREQWVIPYALKALFPTLVWLRLSYELLFTDFNSTNSSLCNE